MKIRIIILAAIALLTLALVPFSIKGTPMVIIRVVDEAGKPVPGVPVYRNWEHFGLDRRGMSDTQTGQKGEAMFSPETFSASFCSRALIHLRELSPHMSFGSRTHIDIFCPVGYELRLAQPDFDAIRRTGDFAWCRSRDGDTVLIDYRPSDPKEAPHYSVTVSLNYNRVSSVEFTLPIRRVGQQDL